MRLTLFSACVFIGLGLVGGCNEPPAAIPPQPPRVSVMHPEQRDLTALEEFNGWMAADKTVEFAPVFGDISRK